MQIFSRKASPELWVISISDVQAKHLFYSLNPDLDSVIEFTEA